MHSMHASLSVCTLFTTYRNNLQHVQCVSPSSIVVLHHMPCQKWCSSVHGTSSSFACSSGSTWRLGMSSCASTEVLGHGNMYLSGVPVTSGDMYWQKGWSMCQGMMTGGASEVSIGMATGSPLAPQDRFVSESACPAQEPSAVSMFSLQTKSAVGSVSVARGLGWVA